MKKATTGDRSVALYDTEGFTALRKSRALGQVGQGQHTKLHLNCHSPGLHCVSLGDHRDPLPRQLLWTLAQLGAPRCCPCSCGFLPGFLFKVCAWKDKRSILLFWVVTEPVILKDCTMWLWLLSALPHTAESEHTAGLWCDPYSFNLQVQSFGLSLGPGENTEKRRPSKCYSKFSHPRLPTLRLFNSALLLKYSQLLVSLIHQKEAIHVTFDFWLWRNIKTKLKEIMMAFVYKQNIIYIFSLHLIQKFITTNQRALPKAFI